MNAETDKVISCRLHIRPIEEKIDLGSLAAAVAKENRPVILGANSSVERYSVFAAEPVEIFEFRAAQTNPFERLEDVLGRYRLEPHRQEKTFCPGWMGYFSYDLARHIEQLPDKTTYDVEMPLIYLAFYDSAIVYDHRDGRMFMAALEFENDSGTEKKFQWLRNLLEQSRSIRPVVRSAQIRGGKAVPFKSNMTQDYYFNAVARIKRHICDGDVYQINFSQRFECDFPGDAFELFSWQNAFNPSPYAAFLSSPDFAVVSASPELFLQVNGDNILTKPIKGTRPRRRDDEEFNRRQYAELLKSKKDAAELAMIVDLERNDLARICIPGTRQVLRERIVESYPTVYHAFGEVAGTLAGTKGPRQISDILRATFPGGSITGAPKIAAMNIIENLEPTRRGLYTGSIGWIGANFDMCLNIAIRTIILKNEKAYAQTGGGIVADSDPHAEWDETLVKAKALLQGINACS